MINFDTTKDEAQKIIKIMQRALALDPSLDAMSTDMDLTACHMNGNPLNLDGLLLADDYNLMHDIYGLRKHMDRETGKLTGCFSPRFSRKG